MALSFVIVRWRNNKKVDKKIRRAVWRPKMGGIGASRRRMGDFCANGAEISAIAEATKAYGQRRCVHRFAP